MDILTLENLEKTYKDVRAVKSLSLKVEKGQVFGLLGPNGSGKTTTLAIALGIVAPDKGKASWFGSQPSTANLKKIGSLLESPNFYPYLNLYDNLKIICQIKALPLDEIGRVLKLVDLFDRRKSKFQNLSYGMKQRLALAAVLMGDPEVLVLDEPANGLDPEGIAEVRKIIRQEAERGKTIVMASHILDEVEKVCSHVAILRKGELLKYGPVGSLLRAEVIMVLSSDDTTELENALKEAGEVSVYHVDGKDIHATLKEGCAPGDLNKRLVSKGIVLSKMEVHKQSLEEQFLELVRQANEEGGSL